MNTRKLGKQGPTVSALGLGCMGMTGIYGEPDDAESIATIHRAIDLGLNLIVTSDAYGAGSNEELVGRAIRAKRSEVLLATKFGNLGMGGFKLPEGLSPGHPDYVKQACDASLRRLGVEVIDVYGLHRVDPKVPIEETDRGDEATGRIGEGALSGPVGSGAADHTAGARGASDSGAGDRIFALVARRRNGNTADVQGARDRLHGVFAAWSGVPYRDHQDRRRVAAERPPSGPPPLQSGQHEAKRQPSALARGHRGRSQGDRRHKWRWPGCCRRARTSCRYRARSIAATSSRTRRQQPFHCQRRKSRSLRAPSRSG